MENNENLREQAVANIAFRVHALIYLLVNSGLLVIDLLFDNSSSINWFYYAATVSYTHLTLPTTPYV